MLTAAGACPTAAAVRELRRRGFALCKPDRGTKCPTAKSWSVRSLETRDFSAGDLIGIMGGSLSDGGSAGHALAILDLDDEQALELADHCLPATAMAEGRESKPRSHRYYLVPLDTIPEWAHSTADQASKAARAAAGHPGPFTKSFRHANTNAEVLRLIGTGGQVVCPPSAHPSGEYREWAGGSPGEPAAVEFPQLWADVCELANACGATVPEVMPRTTRPRPPVADARDRFRAYLPKCQPAISGQGGHSCAFWAARVGVWGFDLPPEVALEVLLHDYNPRCEPPFSEKEWRHKVENADRVPFQKSRGWLLQESRPYLGAGGNGKPARDEPRPAPASEPDTATPPPTSGPLTGTQVILAYFRQRYRPLFRRGNAVVCADGDLVPMNVACAVPDSKLIDQLGAAVDAPAYKGGGLNRNALPGYFKSWAKVAWGDLLVELPDEDTADLGADSPARDEFRRLVREAMLSEVVLGEQIGGTTATQTERRPLIDWCYRFAKVGVWRDIRGKRCWCKLVDRGGAEVVLKVAIRHELFAQVNADRRLREMGMNTFTRRAVRYGVGTSTRDERPHGVSAVVLADELVSDLLAGLTEGEPAEGDRS